jgi:hypothetical protein
MTIREQTITMFIIQDVPEDTRFETQTRKEISVRDNCNFIITLFAQ